MWRLPPHGDRCFVFVLVFVCIAIHRRSNALAVTSSNAAWSRILAYCSSVKVNERGAVFTPVSVCSRMVWPRSDIIYYLRHAPRFPVGKTGFPVASRHPNAPAGAGMKHKCGGGYAASRQELTVRGGKPPTHCLRWPAAIEKKMGGGAGSDDD